MMRPEEADTGMEMQRIITRRAFGVALGVVAFLFLCVAAVTALSQSGVLYTRSAAWELWLDLVWALTMAATCLTLAIVLLRNTRGSASGGVRPPAP